MSYSISCNPRMQTGQLTIARPTRSTFTVQSLWDATQSIYRVERERESCGVARADFCPPLCSYTMDWFSLQSSLHSIWVGRDLLLFSSSVHSSAFLFVLFGVMRRHFLSICSDILFTVCWIETRMLMRKQKKLYSNFHCEFFLLFFRYRYGFGSNVNDSVVVRQSSRRTCGTKIIHKRWIVVLFGGYEYCIRN